MSSKQWCKNKKDWIEQPIVCTRQNLKPGYLNHRHIGETTSRATALDLQSEDYESKTYKPFVENPCCYPTHRCFIDTFTNWGHTAKWSHQDGRSKFLVFKNETIEARSTLSLDQCFRAAACLGKAWSLVPSLLWLRRTKRTRDLVGMKKNITWKNSHELTAF